MCSFDSIIGGALLSLNKSSTKKIPQIQSKAYFCPMNLSARYQLFLAFSFLLFLMNLFIMNDVATLWNGAESKLIWDVLQGEKHTIAHFFLSDLIQKEPLNLFVLRSIGPALLLLSLGGFYYFGRKILGQETLILGIAVLGASLLLPNLAKRATSDLYVFSSQLFGFIFLLRHLKQAQRHWQISFYIAFALSIWLQPINSFLFFTLTASVLYFYHKDGKKLNLLLIAGFGILLLLIVFIFGNVIWGNPTFEFNGTFSTFPRFLMWSILGCLPFIGFLTGGIRETIWKAQKGEELAIIMSSLGIGALLSSSIMLQVFFALLVAKQMQHYFLKNYPHENFVKTAAILHLLIAFGLAFLLTMGGIFQFKGQGFWAGALVGGIYWILSFVSIIGLYGKVKRLVIAGLIWSGLLGTQLFWSQAYPLIEMERNIPERFLQKTVADQQAAESTLYLVYPSYLPFPNVATYASTVFKKVEGDDTFVEEALSEKNTVLIHQAALADKELSVQVDTISGWTDQLREINYYLPKLRPLENKEE